MSRIVTGHSQVLYGHGCDIAAEKLLTRVDFMTRIVTGHSHFFQPYIIFMMMGPTDKDKRTALGPNNGRATAFNFYHRPHRALLCRRLQQQIWYILIMVDVASRYTDTDSSRTIPAEAVAERY